ncbi:MAG: glycosyltransferase [Dehalococcoidales bacterium]|nr:glycosyltransferase [Dehalococcoidales bacterium]
MIDETLLMLSQLEDLSRHKLAKHIADTLATYTAADAPIFQNYYRALQQLFSRVIVYDWAKRMTEVGIKAVNTEVIELVRREHPKYVLWFSTDYEFQESTFDSIREEGSLVIGWFFDDERRFDDYSKWWIPHLDYCVTFFPQASPKYAALGARVLQPISCEGVPVDRDWSKVEEKYDVTFVGLKYLDREGYIKELKKRGIPVQVFGMGWGQKKGGGFLPFEEMIDIFSTSKINLNFSRAAGSDAEMGLKGRMTMVCLAGGFLLTEYVPGIENYFQIDKEIVCFHDVKEMIDKADYYLKHGRERRAIAQAGWKRATTEYTPFHMFSRVFRQIEEELSLRGKESQPQELGMPRPVRKKFSDYYLSWGAAFSKENYKGLGKEALALSLRYYPFNARSWYYYLVSFLPYLIRRVILGLCRAFYFRTRAVFQKTK